MPSLAIRPATSNDVGVVLTFIRALAEFEKLLDKVVVTEEIIREHLFGERRYAEVILAEWEGRPAGFALFFHNYSTFLGRPGVYLEDLFVYPEYRGRGIGKQLLAHLAQMAIERNCDRVDWIVLNWNEPAMGFYSSLGAFPLDEWMVYRLTGEPLKTLSAKAVTASSAAG